jgi:hypothetical protein|uniref:Uncharacterized protein n=1 Tax=viral metagenome TaxID=1070528 RepID=A0A6C0DMN7_9ZZZZ
MSLYSQVERPPITKKSTLSKMIANFFNRKKGAKIGIIDENIDTNNINDYEASIRKASPTETIELYTKTKPTIKSRTSKKPLSINGGNSRNLRKSKTSKKSKTLKKYKNKK